jgi:DNA-binding CsgD family transcriptional regulator
MSPLSAHDYDLMLDLARDILVNPDPQDAWDLVGRSLTTPVIGGDASLHGVIHRTGRGAEFTHVFPGDVIRQVPPAPTGFPITMDAYTTRRYRDASGATTAIRATDWIPTPQWQRTPSYADLNEAFGIRHVLVLPLAPGPTCDRTILIARASREFSDRHVEIAQRIHPLLAAVDAHLHHLRRWRELAPGPAGAPSAEVAAAEVKLTPRELVVLTLLAEGLTAATIAQRLAISVRTMHKHRENLYRKLGTSDRLAAVLQAQRLSLLPRATVGA